ncbi:shewanella-like protein phosphatase 2 [Vicia villosa]|uniref:shewanella-like protein phosphatase 2 n=1 Tax=Vicia villosa TaxID=3911 RepID=UPI00273B5E94|nr:shewanella-like protein phosphatase 2 [Vicia villosa]
MEIEKQNSFCKQIPNIFSSFVDTFVDFSVSGLFLLPPPSSPPPPPPTRLPSPHRLIAIGDLHGDLKKSKDALRIAGVIDASGRYTGGSSTVVQIGDIMDRGNDEIKILYLMEKLKREAARCGGRFVTMNGNHEILNVEGDFRYATRSGLKEFKNWLYWFRQGNKMKRLCKRLEPVKDPLDGVRVEFRGVRKKYHDGFRARVAALRRNGPISGRFFSQNATVLVVGDSVFVHGGLLKQHVDYGLEKINREVSDWFKGLYGQRLSPWYCRADEGVVWLRKFSEGKCDCSSLDRVLSTIPGAKRMIMGHTIQTGGINSVCGKKAIRIDVGMSKGCGGGLPEVLEIDRNAGMRILTSDMLYKAVRIDVGDVMMEEKGFRMLLDNQHDGPKQIEGKA